MLIHDREAPGVPILQKLKADLTYQYEDIDGGGRVRISTKNQQAISAVQEFLRYQISDHRTGDPTEVTRARAGAE
jgi:hypothetical protein